MNDGGSRRVTAALARTLTDPNRARQDLDAVAAEYDGFAVLGTVVHQRAAFERAEALGLAVTELDKPSESDRKARDAIAMLHDEVFGAAAVAKRAEAAIV